ncbi:hypothetical protein HRI97_07025 [Treponema socranskii subsp. buccale]|uniref:hypothetical protein n=1 Tax=Treponema socranskii TaxID=53419 RepID=UPI0020A5093F|nr:hypothetical protein [Treponema socranskii]UTD02828.1 hypothetical protein HRI97_07025 [Treponema socranskii subsp. buccale]
MRVVSAALLFAAFVSFVSCTKKSSESIRLDVSDPLALAPDISWAVVLDPYAAYRHSPSWDDAAEGYCRKGDILQVTGKAAVKESGTWYKFKDGWLPDSAVTIYANRYRAENAAEKLK